MTIWSWLGEALGFVARKAAKEAARRAAEVAINAAQRHADGPAPFKPLDVGEKVRRVDLTPDVRASALQDRVHPASGPLIRSTPIKRGFVDPEAPTDPDRTPTDNPRKR